MSIIIFAKSFLAERGFEYYDFNLAKEKYLNLEDEDFSDDNHFSKQGVYKWTQVFCDYFFTGSIPKKDMFYTSYTEKLQNQNDKIYGLYLIQSQDKKSIKVTPLVNHVNKEEITYDVYFKIDGKEELIEQNSSNDNIILPSGKNGKIRVISYINGIKQTDCIENFAAF